MRIVAQLKLLPTAEQRELLLRTQRTFNSCCNLISLIAFNERTFNRFALSARTYRECRDSYPLGAEMVVRAINRVAESYRADRKSLRWFKPRSATVYCPRTMRFKGSAVSISTLAGRIEIPFVCGEYQRELLKGQRGQSDLITRIDGLFLHTTCEVHDEPLIQAKDCLGVDFGIANIAADSDARQYSGSQVKSVRYRHRRLRTKLQKKCTRSAKRLLKKLSGKERRFSADVNHVISKQIVANAKDTERAVALEDLTGIAERVTVRSKKQRVILRSWAFYQLRQFVTYKAQRSGVPVFLVDPRNTSRKCSICGHTDKRNRPSQERFRCVSCGYTAHADYNAACNLRSAGRAAASLPNVADCVHVEHDLVTSA